MMRTKRPAFGIAVGLALTSAVVSASCSAEEPTEPSCKPPACPFDYASVVLDTPDVSFESDVFPILRRSCGLSSVCHGSETSSAAKLYLGPKKSDTVTVIDTVLYQKIIDGVANVPSKTAPEMDLIEPGDPSKSFLMLKMDGCHDVAGLACTPQPKSKSGAKCGDRMPQGNSSLCADDRDVIRRWIAQGAAND